MVKMPSAGGEAGEASHVDLRVNVHTLQQPHHPVIVI